MFPYYHTSVLRTLLELDTPTLEACIFVLFHKNILFVEKTLHLINKSHLLSSKRNDLYTKVLHHTNIEEVFLALEKLSKGKFLDDEDENEYLFSELLKTPYPSYLVSSFMTSVKYREVIAHPGRFVDYKLLKKLVTIYAHKGKNDEPKDRYKEYIEQVPELRTGLHGQPGNEKENKSLNSLSDFQILFSKPRIGQSASMILGSVKPL